MPNLRALRNAGKPISTGPFAMLASSNHPLDCLKSLFSNGVQQAVYECDCGGTVKRVLPSESGQASRQTGPYANHKIRAATPRTLRMTENDNRLLRRN